MDNTQQPQAMTPQNGNGEKKVGPIVASLIIVLVLVIAALYLFASRVKEPVIPEDDYAAGADNTGGSADNLGTSTDVKDLQADLDKTASGLDNQSF